MAMVHETAEKRMGGGGGIEMRILMDDCISLRLGAEYIGVHDLEGKEPLL